MENILNELEKARKKIPPELFLKLIQELYFQTSWEWIRELIENENIDPEMLFKYQLHISKETGVQGANALKPFNFTGSPLEKIVKKFIFAALNMGVKSNIKFIDDNECEIIFTKNCGHGLKIKQYKLPFECSDWCETHFNAEINSLNPNYAIKLIEGLPEGKRKCKFLIYRK
ncbi:MAG: hypothetical protein EU549_04725 [Promethearchaeota archaeon]|nr:MAG: hypothetical protein EU549_04725 [Candidatus Lokiarchaeota archaeon]